MSAQVGILIKATDEASRIVADATTKIQGDLGRVDEAGKKLKDSQEKLNTSAKGLVLGFSGVATSAFALYNAFDAVQDMQVSVDRANVAAKSSLNAVEDAQRRYNEALRKHGEDSEQAQAAAKDLTLAQERYQVAAERAEMVQGNLNERMVSSALTVIPSVITMVGSLKAIKESWTIVTNVMAVAQRGLNAAMSANPIGLVITVISILIGVLATAYATCEPFRNAVNAVGSALMGVLKPAIDTIGAGLNWLNENVIKPIVGTIKWFAEAVGNAWDWITGKTKSAQAEISTSVSTLTSGISQDFAQLDDAVVGKSSWTAMWDKVEGRLQNAVGPITGQITALTTSVKTSFSDMAKTVESIWGGTVRVIEEGGLRILDMRDKVETAAGKIAEKYTMIEGKPYYVTEGYQKAIALGYQMQAQAILDQRKAAQKDMADMLARTLASAREQEALWAAHPELRPITHEGPSGEEIWAEELEARRLNPAQFGFSGWVGSPTLFLAGERGPEYVSITPGGKGGTISIQGPLVQILGSADRSTAELAARLVEERLKNVLSEASSSSAPATHKRIRFGSVF